MGKGSKLKYKINNVEYGFDPEKVRKIENLFI